MYSSIRLALLIILSASLINETFAYYANENDANSSSINNQDRSDSSSAAERAAQDSRASSTLAESILRTSDIAAAIEKFKLASTSAAAVNEQQSGQREPPPDSQSKSRPNSNERSEHAAAAQSNEPVASTDGGQSPTIKRKIVRSRYRLRNQKEPESALIDRRQTPAAFSNYSQPFDAGAQQPASLAASSYTAGSQDQSHYLPQLGRALGSSSAIMPVAPSSFSDAPVSSFGYLAADGGGGGSSPAQRVANVVLPSSLGGDTQGVGPASSPYAVASGESVHNQDNGIVPDSYVSVARLNQPSSSNLHFPSISRMYSGGGGGQFRAPPAGPDVSGHYMAAPSSHFPAYSDYYGSASSVPGGADYHAAEPNDHYVHRNYSSYQPDFDPAGGSGGAGAHMSPYDYADGPLLSARGRWSWPWTDASSLGFGGGGNSMNTAATFKKHHHHHHYHPKHKEHHHHDGDDHMMAKWEHGITIGEIVCVAVAVVLGIIILGSPFFLLFLMLFNGGNLFGATQMGLLAPASVQAAATPAVGRRRRRRSIETTDDGDSSDRHAKKSSSTKIRPSELIRVGEYLFEQLSPYMDMSKLMSSFERIMDVKDGIDKIVNELGKQGKFEATNVKEKTADSHQHIEMRRRKR
jgi:hypothetical protein